MQVTNSTRQRPVFLQDIHSCVLKSCSRFANDFAISASTVGALNTPVEYLTKHQLFQVETEASNMQKLQGKLHLSNKKHELSKTSRLQVEPVRIPSSQTKTGGETDSPPVHKSTLVRAVFYPLGRDASAAFTNCWIQVSTLVSIIFRLVRTALIHRDVIRLRLA
jgi:hypothetical protein